MPIEIKELIIKMTVSEKMPERLNIHSELPSVAKDKIVKECVEKVLRKLESKIER
jgi:hypothetical protein